jgi:hypothetical protein
MSCKYKITDNLPRIDWESFLDELGSGNLQQSFDYGEAQKMADPHTRVLRFSAIDGIRPVGLIQARYNRRFGFGDQVSVGGAYGYGPSVTMEDEKSISLELLRSLNLSAIKNRVSEGFIYRPRTDKLLEDLGYDLNEIVNVYRVGLQETSERLWKNIAHNKRNNIKKAQEQGAEVVHSKSYDDLVSFYDLLKITAERVGFIPPHFNYFNSFLKFFEANDRSMIFLVVFDHQPVAGVLVVVHGDIAYALAAGSMKETWKIRPNDLLHWKAMEWAVSKGLSWYHLGFVSEPPPTEDSPGGGLWRWKREWNGQFEKAYVYRKIYMPKFKKFFINPYKKTIGIVQKIGF